MASSRPTIQFEKRWLFSLTLELNLSTGRGQSGILSARLCESDLNLTGSDPVAAVVLLLSVGVFPAVLSFIAWRKLAAAGSVRAKSLQALPLLGDDPLKPQRILVKQSVEDVKTCFSIALRGAPLPQSWSASHWSEEMKLESMMTWNGVYKEGDFEKNRYELTSQMKINACILSYEAGNFLEWSFDPDSFMTVSPREHHRDPKAIEYALETNLTILKALGLLTN